MEMTWGRALELLRDGREGVREWNGWREENPHRALPDLRYADLSNADLSNADLSDADLTDAKFCRANLIHANLGRANLIDADLSNADLSDADLTDAKFYRANLIDANLGRAVLSDADLTDANLRRANLIDANLGRAVLSDADLIRANLRRANLIAANLGRADLSYAELSNANLSGAILKLAELGHADLSHANLSSANLNHATLRYACFNATTMDATDLSMCELGYTVFGQTDLSTVKGLQSINHRAGSTIDSQTLITSGSLPCEFLEGCGVADSLIEYLPSLIGSLEPIQFYSCFISYSHQDEEFCKRLHSRLRDDGLRVWYAPEDLQSGKKLHHQIEDAIRIHDKLLLVLSSHSMKSDWVQTEIYNARQREKKEGKAVLFPIRLCGFDAIKKWKAFDADTGKDMAREVREYYVPGDFENWKDHDAFEAGYAKLLADLKAGAE